VEILYITLNEHSFLCYNRAMIKADISSKFKNPIRTLSGVTPVALLTKPYPCPGECIYCPQEANVPKSYLSSEPAVMRALACNYDPEKQIETRIKTYPTLTKKNSFLVSITA